MNKFYVFENSFFLSKNIEDIQLKNKLLSEIMKLVPLC